MSRDEGKTLQIVEVEESVHQQLNEMFCINLHFFWCRGMFGNALWMDDSERKLQWMVAKACLSFCIKLKLRAGSSLKFLSDQTRDFQKETKFKLSNIFNWKFEIMERPQVTKHFFWRNFQTPKPQNLKPPKTQNVKPKPQTKPLNPRSQRVTKFCKILDLAERYLTIWSLPAFLCLNFWACLWEAFDWAFG